MAINKKALWITGIAAVVATVSTISYFVLKPKSKTGNQTGGVAGDATGKGSVLTNIKDAIKTKLGGQSDVLNGGGSGSGSSWIDSIFGGGGAAGTATAGTVFPVLSFDEKTSGATDLVITLDAPRPKVGTLNSGDKVVLAGMGERFNGQYKIYNGSSGGIYNDANTGNIGAIYIKTGKSTANLTYTKADYPNATITKI